MVRKTTKYKLIQQFRQENYDQSDDNGPDDGGPDKDSVDVECEKMETNDCINTDEIVGENIILSPSGVHGPVPSPLKVHGGIKLTFEEKLKKLFSNHIRYLTNEFVTDILNLLREEGYNKLPKTAVTFLHTAKCGRDYEIRPMKSFEGKDGVYVYLGIETKLSRYINPQIYPSSKIKVFCNADGLKVYFNNSNKEEMWPILIKIYTKKCKSKVFMAGAFYGKSKPACPADFMEDFIHEINRLIEFGAKIGEKSYKFIFDGFICDIPARVWLKCTQGATGFWACERCDVKGVTIKPIAKPTQQQVRSKKQEATSKKQSRKGEKRIFAETGCELRTHEKFLNRKH